MVLQTLTQSQSTRLQIKHNIAILGIQGDYHTELTIAHKGGQKPSQNQAILCIVI